MYGMLFIFGLFHTKKPKTLKNFDKKSRFFRPRDRQTRRPNTLPSEFAGDNIGLCTYGVTHYYWQVQQINPVQPAFDRALKYSHNYFHLCKSGRTLFVLTGLAKKDVGGICSVCFRFGERGFFYSSPAAWNTLPSDLHDITDTITFRKQLKSVLFDRAYH